MLEAGIREIVQRVQDYSIRFCTIHIITLMLLTITSQACEFLVRHPQPEMSLSTATFAQAHTGPLSSPTAS
jgi:hypothetical protein